MTSNHGSEINPYQSPSLFETGTETSPAVLSDVLRKFRAQTLALGVFWIVVGAVAAGLGFIYLLPGSGLSAFVRMVFAVWGIVFFILVLCTCGRQIWAVYAGVVLWGATSLLTCLVTPVCTVVFLVIGILPVLQA